MDVTTNGHFGTIPGVCGVCIEFNSLDYILACLGIIVLQTVNNSLPCHQVLPSSIFHPLSTNNPTPIPLLNLHSHPTFRLPPLLPPLPPPLLPLPLPFLLPYLQPAL